MPRPGNRYEKVDKEYDKMTLDEVKELLESNDKEEIKEYTKYLTRKANKARSLFNSGKPKKKGGDLSASYTEHWNELIAKRKKKEKKVSSKIQVEEEKVNNTYKRKLTDLEINIINFKKKYLIDVENVGKELEASLSEMNSKTRLTKYGEGGRKSYNFTIDDSKKDEFYNKYKDSYKRKFKDAYKLFLKKGRVEINSNNIDEFIKSYDSIIRNVIYEDKKVYVPYYGGMTRAEMKSIMTSNFNVKYVNDSYFDKYLSMSIKDLEKLKAKDINQILAETHKEFGDTLKNALSDTDLKVQKEKVFESIKKSYIAVSMIHASHGFWFKLFNKKTVAKEQAFLDAIKNTCMNKFKIQDEEFVRAISSPFKEGYTFVQSRDSYVKNITTKLAFNLKTDSIIKEEVEPKNELEDEEVVEENQNRINIDVSVDEANKINEAVLDIEEKEVSEELNK